MQSPGPKNPAEREDTDESLHVEREKTDTELIKRHAAIEEVGAVISKARGRADEVLEEARHIADEMLEREGSSGDQRRAVEAERQQQDLILQQERASADVKSLAERQGRLAALANLLRLEREQTDDRLEIERARADDALIARDDFMGLVRHDLRSLLGGIALAADLQVKNATSDEAGALNLKLAQRIQRFVARTNRLIGDLDDTASIEAGRFTMAPEAGDVVAVVRECVDAFQPTADAKGIALTLHAAPASIVTRFDRERILQVLANLIGNAIKFTDERGSVSVRVELLEGQVRVAVTDTGRGITPHHLERIFQRFWQEKQGDRRGLGLGLFISKCIVEAHGGRIWAESVPGEGSTLSFALPPTLH